MKLNTLRELYIEELKDIYNAEHQLLKALPKLAKAASSSNLKTAFQEHLNQTQAHIQRLETIFETLNESPKGKKCRGMEGVIVEADEMIAEEADPEVKDAGLISAAQRAEHYEMAAYGCVRTYAKLLGDDQAATLLQQTLDEEGDTDKRLTKIAKSINVEAVDNDSEEMSETATAGAGKAKSNGRSGKRSAM